MSKQIFILNGVGGSGKGTFVSYLSKYVSLYYYSIVALPKEAAKILGWYGGKTEKDRKFLSDITDIATVYNDIPFRDVASLVSDFKDNKIESDVLIVDMRESQDIKRAVETFGAKTILVRNPRVSSIVSNHADREVENYKYDYIIDNIGTLKDLDDASRRFARFAIKQKRNI